jgi:TonB family protein
MKISRVMAVLVTLLASDHTQGQPDYYVASLQMPCYPPLARQAGVQGRTEVKIEVGSDGTVTSAEAVKGNPLLQSASLTNARTWKFAGGQGTDLSRLRTTIAFEYKLEGESGWERCAARVIFDSFNKVQIIGHPVTLDTTR